MLFITPMNKYLKDVILSNGKNLVFSFSHEILQGVYPELNDGTLRYPQGDKAKG